MACALTNSTTTIFSALRINRLALWTRRREALLNKVCKITPAYDLDADEGRRIKNLIAALNRAELIRRTFNTEDASKIES
jgi:hypothetical protein